MEVEDFGMAVSLFAASAAINGAHAQTRQANAQTHYAYELVADYQEAHEISSATSAAYAKVSSEMTVALIEARGEIHHLRIRLDDAASERAELIALAAELIAEIKLLKGRLH